MGYRVAVVGATGNVGREMLTVLAERQFPIDEIAAVASARSTGDIIDFGDSGETLKVRNLEHFDFNGWDMAISSIGNWRSASTVSISRPTLPVAPALCDNVFACFRAFLRCRRSGRAIHDCETAAIGAECSL